MFISDIFWENVTWAPNGNLKRKIFGMWLQKQIAPIEDVLEKYNTTFINILLKLFSSKWQFETHFFIYFVLETCSFQTFFGKTLLGPEREFEKEDLWDVNAISRLHLLRTFGENRTQHSIKIVFFKVWVWKYLKGLLALLSMSFKHANEGQQVYTPTKVIRICIQLPSLRGGVYENAINTNLCDSTSSLAVGGTWVGALISSQIPSCGSSRLAWQADIPALNMVRTFSQLGWFPGYSFSQENTPRTWTANQPLVDPFALKMHKMYFMPSILLSKTNCLGFELQEPFGKCLLISYGHLGYKKKNQFWIQYAPPFRFAQHVGAQGRPVFSSVVNPGETGGKPMVWISTL